MPTAPRRPCHVSGCPELQPCAAHGRRARPSFAARREAEPHRALYDTRRWRRLRLLTLAEQPLCVLCLEASRVTPAVDVDHVTPHRGDVALFYDPANLRGLCKVCHGEVTAAARNERREP